jgi:hypothetical protein
MQKEKSPAEQAFKNPSPEDMSGVKDAGQDESAAGKNQPQADDKNPKTARNKTDGLDKTDLPDSSNESRGAMGSGQRQDSN